MFETAIVVLIVSALMLTLGSAVGRLILHRMYGPELPQGVQSLADAFTVVFTTGAAVLLAPFKIFHRIYAPPTTAPTLQHHTAQSLPTSEPKKIVQQ